MVCVLFAHTNVNHYFLHLAYSPWFLSMFFLISGYLFKVRNFRDDVIRLLKSLIFPYFMLNFILFFLGVDNWHAFLQKDFPFLVGKIKSIAMGEQLWFVACLIVVQLLFLLLNYLVLKSIKSKIFACGIFFLSIFITNKGFSSIWPFYAHISIFSMAFFSMGDLLKRIDIAKYSLVINQFKFLKKILFLVVLPLFYFLLCLFFDSFFDIEFHYMQNTYNNVPIYLILSFVGMLVVFILSNMLKSNILRLLGANSLICFAFNSKAYAVANLVVAPLNINCSYITAFLLVLIEVAILLCISFFVNRFCPFIIGKKWCSRTA